MRRRLRWVGTLISVALLFPLPAVSANTTVELAAEASRPAVNDLARSTVFAEATGKTPEELSRQVNKLISEALKIAKSYSSVKTHSGGSSTYPIYSKGGQIESWRMRSELSLESGNLVAMAELLGKLQTLLAVSNLVLLPSPATLQAAEDEAILEAIAAFKGRAKVIADALGRSYRIKQLSVNTSGRVVQPMYRAVAKTALADSAAMPIEAGESLASVNVSGQIELE